MGKATVHSILLDIFAATYHTGMCLVNKTLLLLPFHPLILTLPSKGMLM